MRHRSITSKLTNEQHAKFTEIAARRGLKPTTFATQEIVKLIEAENDAID
jgi:hypothetical protein